LGHLFSFLIIQKKIDDLTFLLWIRRWRSLDNGWNIDLTKETTTTSPSFKAIFEDRAPLQWDQWSIFVTGFDPT
jgi:hypothetical protein